jgi:hypothetical protein
MRESVSRLVTSWDDSLADSIAAMNLYLDDPGDRRRERITSLVAQLGACRNEGPFDVENALRGRWMMRCDRGALEVAITLAPTIPPRVQYLRVTQADSVVRFQPAPSCPSRE